MIHFLVADDEEATAMAIKRLIINMISVEFNVKAEGTVCTNVKEALGKIDAIGADVDLIVLDMSFKGDILGGGLRILDALSPQLRLKVVVYSDHLAKPIGGSGPALSEHLRTAYGITGNRAIDMMQGPDAIWNACSKVLKNKLG